LFEWFGKRREMKTLEMIQRHLALTMNIVEDLERAVRAATENREEEMRLCISRVTDAEREADGLRRKVMQELSRGELPPTDREDLMHLAKRVDMVADWGRESTRILNAIPRGTMPDTLKKSSLEMVAGVKECAFALRKCINQLAKKTEEALKAADEVERLEEWVDDLYESARILLGRDTTMSVGAAILMGELLNAIEMVADWCEDACDQVRVIVVRRQQTG
jgi:predicted phosphate transport protein (TIGR00153 family)